MPKLATVISLTAVDSVAVTYDENKSLIGEILLERRSVNVSESDIDACVSS